MAPSELVAGVGVGGTRIAAGLADGEGRVVVSPRATTASEGGTRAMAQIVGLLEEVFREAGAVGWRVSDWRQAGKAWKQGEGWLESLASGPAAARAAGRSTTEDALRGARADHARGHSRSHVGA